MPAHPSLTNASDHARRTADARGTRTSPAASLSFWRGSRGMSHSREITASTVDACAQSTRQRTHRRGNAERFDLNIPELHARAGMMIL
jgi:hypothetical protein